MTFEKADQDALVRDAWAKVFYSRDVDLGRRNWDDMGGGEPSDERIEWELALDPLLSALAAERDRADRAEADLAEAWDSGVRCAGGYGHEDGWTDDMTPLRHNPYRSETTA